MKLKAALAESKLDPVVQTRLLDLWQTQGVGTETYFLVKKAISFGLSPEAVEVAAWLSLPPSRLRGVKLDLGAKQFLTALEQRQAWIKQTNLTRESNLRRLIELLASQDGEGVNGLLMLAALTDLKRLQGQAQLDQAELILRLYAPLANRLGVGQLKAELQDQAFKLARPDQYHLISQLLEQFDHQKQLGIKDLKQNLKSLLKLAGIKLISIEGRQKQPYSIYQKLQKKTDFTAIADLIAFRLIVPTVADCYRALEAVHRHYQPVESEFDDYIAHPKTNGYRSLHTAVQLGKGQLAEVQIRTPKMHEISERGVAAHWHYDQHKATKAYKKDRSAQTTKATSRSVFVWSPTGDLWKLKEGAVALDFAFAIHTAVGLQTRGVKINGQMAKLDSPLATGDTLEVLTQATAQPNRDWLKFVVTPLARNRINAWLKATDSNAYRELGEQLLKEEAIKQRVRPSKSALALLIKASEYADKEEFYTAIGAGRLSTEWVIAQLKKAQPTATAEKTVSSLASAKVRIGGLDGLSYGLADCCQPQPPEPIIGYLSANLGFKVHRQDCSRLPQVKERQIVCEWV